MRGGDKVFVQNLTKIFVLKHSQGKTGHFRREVEEEGGGEKRKGREGKGRDG